MKLILPDPPGYSPDPLHQGTFAPTERMHPTFPMPDPRTGELKIDPEIQLKALGFDLSLSMYYSTNANFSTSWGVGRSASVSGSLQQSPGTIATITRGDFTEQFYQEVGTSGGVTTYASSLNTGNITTLAYNVSSKEYTEYFLDGMQLVYKNVVGSGYVNQIERVVDAAGNTQTYTYGTGVEVGLLKSITVPGGSSLDFSYIPGYSASLVSTIEDWSGRTWTLQYDAFDYLTTMTTPLGCTTKYGYSLAGAGAGNTMIYSIEDPQGYVTSYGYNSSRQVTTMTAGSAVWSYSYNGAQTIEYLPSGGKITYNYGSGGDLASKITADGVPHTYSYNTNRMLLTEQTPAGTIYNVQYDSLNRLAFSWDPLGNKTSYQYDANSNLTTLTSPDGGITTYGYEGAGDTRLRIRQTDPLGRVTSYAYTGRGLLQSTTDPRGLTTTNSYDAYGNPVSIQFSDGGIITNTFDSLGRTTATTDQLGRTTSYTYDVASHVTSVQNPLGAISTYIYNGCLLQAEVNPLNQRSTYTYGRFNRRTLVENALGYLTTTNYDNMGYPIATIDANGNTSTTSYDVAKRVIAQIDPLGNATTYAYDSAGRQNQVTNARGYISTSVFNARDLIATIDPLGNRTSYSYDSMARRTAVKDPLGYLTTSQYDLAGQVTTTIDALSNTTTYGYNPNGGQILVTDPLGHATQTVYFATSNRVQATIDALGNATTYTFDLAGEQTARQDARGNFISFAYDGAGRQTVITNEIGYATTTAYDAAGRPATILDANGWLRTLTFDAVGQELVTAYADGTAVTSSYDPVGNRTTMVDWGGTSTYTYSARNELLVSNTPTGYPQSYSYDSVGNRSGMVNPDGTLVTYAYDGNNALTAQQLPGSRIYTTQHDASGNPTTVTFNGGQRLMSYDGLGRVITQTEYRGATIISTLTDGYDAGGRKVSQTRDGVSTLYGYDNINRLTSQQVSGSVGTYAYDAIGNQTLKWQEGSSPMTMSYDAASRLTTMVQGTATNTFSYDNNGNTLQENLVGGLNQTIYTYDHRNRMATSNQLPNSSPGQYLQTYTYDGEGLRRTKMTNSNSTFTYDKDNNLVSVVSSPQTTTYIWDGADYLAEETGGALEVIYGTMNGQLVEENRGGTVTEYVPDTLGSVVKTTNSIGTVTSSTTFWPYGETNTSTGTNPSNFGYVGTWGYYTDSGNSSATNPVPPRIYIRARTYRPDVSRWLTVDPLWPDEVAYEYGACMPSSLSDPSGNSVVGIQPGGCSFSAPAEFALRCAGVDDCLQRTDKYFQSYQRTKNKFERCASCVSAFICEAAAAGNVAVGVLGYPLAPPLVPPGLFPPGVSPGQLSNCLECMGNCMVRKWERKEGNSWQYATWVCRKYGSGSRQCCVASVSAEQRGYSDCAQSCGCAEFNSLSFHNRVAFALNVLGCCS